MWLVLELLECVLWLDLIRASEQLQVKQDDLSLTLLDLQQFTLDLPIMSGRIPIGSAILLTLGITTLGYGIMACTSPIPPSLSLNCCLY